MCARCGTFGEWKVWIGVGVYKGRKLCPICRVVIKKSKPRTKKKSNNSSRDRQRYLDKVERL